MKDWNESWVLASSSRKGNNRHQRKIKASGLSGKFEMKN